MHFQIPVDDDVVRELAKQGFALDSVPAENERAWLRPNSNVHSGGDGVDATDELRPEEVEMCRRRVNNGHLATDEFWTV